MAIATHTNVSGTPRGVNERGLDRLWLSMRKPVAGQRGEVNLGGACPLVALDKRTRPTPVPADPLDRGDFGSGKQYTVISIHE